jgi:hypothetical protein
MLTGRKMAEKPRSHFDGSGTDDYIARWQVMFVMLGLEPISMAGLGLNKCLQRSKQSPIRMLFPFLEELGMILKKLTGSRRETSLT